MSIEEEEKRVKSGESLISLETQAMNAISTLKAVKINIVALKTAVAEGDEYTTEDATAVQAAIDKILTEISNI